MLPTTTNTSFNPTVRILFLDFDGVLNAGGPRHQRTAYYHNRPPGDRFGEQFHPLAMAAYAHIVASVPDLFVVVTSTWRANGLEEMQQLWQQRGYPGQIDDVTPLSEHCIRGQEVHDYLFARGAYYPVRRWSAPAWREAREKCTVTSYAILDDDPDFFVNQAKHLVRPDDQIGLTMHQAKRVVRLLLSDTIHGC